MITSLNRIYLRYIRLLAVKSLRTILLIVWLLNFLTGSFIYSNTDALTKTGDIPVQTLADSDLTSPEKLFFIQNETQRITENVKVQPLYQLSAALLSKTDLQKKYSAEIFTSEDKIFLRYVFIEARVPRSPPTSLN